MAEFVCNGCGKCCRSFGAFIRIERQVTDRDYYCRYGLTNELFPVHVQPEYAEEIAGEFEDGEGVAGAEKKACPFLRPNKEDEEFVCAIYSTRPPVCREFRCYRMLIYDVASGEERGKVVGSYDLQTRDEALALLWKEKIAGLPHPLPRQHAGPHTPSSGSADDRAWIKSVLAILAAHGYRGDPVE
jgi:hypothetical protein